MIRGTAVLLALGLGACTMTAGPGGAPNPAAQQELARMLAGKVAGPPQNCLPIYNSQDTNVVGPDTIAFRQGGTIYLSHVEGDCSQAQSAGYALVFRSTGIGSPCANDIVEVRASGGFMAGSCVLGPFVPYRTLR